MILKNTNLQRFTELMSDKEIICFGSGKKFDEFFSYCPLLGQVKFIIDNNSDKWDKIKLTESQQTKILAPHRLPSILSDKSVILITTSGVAGIEIFRQLEEMNLPENLSIFWSLFILNEVESWKSLFYSPLPKDLKITKEPLIPKIIHYCWVGGNPMPKQYQEYIDGWKRLCPDYEIICWNEKNYDIEKNQYMKQAYEAKKWGFVPDYIRKDVIYEYGGIYLDTDVELIKKPDDLLYQNGFCGIECRRLTNTIVNFGLGFGARKGLPIIKEIRDVYDNEKFEFLEKGMKIGPAYETEIFLKYGFKTNRQYQIVSDMTIYPLEVLSGTRPYGNDAFITENTYTVHHYSGSWLSGKNRVIEEKIQNLYSMCEY